MPLLKALKLSRRFLIPELLTCSNSKIKVDPKLANRKDDDGRLPIHWAVSSNQFEITNLLVAQKNFDPDVQDDSGWTPLMIAVSIKDGEKLVDLLLGKGADVNEKSEITHRADVPLSHSLIYKGLLSYNIRTQNN